MDTIFQFVLKHGYSVLFAGMFVHQIGLPLPGPLFLLAAGALVATGKLAFIPAFALAVIGCVSADWAWYEAGRRRGEKVLHFIHRLTRDPDHHDRRAKETFVRYGPALLLVAKFVPGLDAVTPPLAGISQTSRLRFLAFDLSGASLYVGVYSALGYFFSDHLDRAAGYTGRAGSLLGGVAACALLIFLVRKLVLHRFLVARHLQVVLVIVKKKIVLVLTTERVSRTYFPALLPVAANETNKAGEIDNAAC